jgi:hypothetical protein
VQRRGSPAKARASVSGTKRTNSVRPLCPTGPFSGTRAQIEPRLRRKSRLIG